MNDLCSWLVIPNETAPVIEDELRGLLNYEPGNTLYDMFEDHGLYLVRSGLTGAYYLDRITDDLSLDFLKMIAPFIGHPAGRKAPYEIRWYDEADDTMHRVRFTNGNADHEQGEIKWL